MITAPSANTPKDIYIGDGTTVEFPVTFEVDRPQDIVVFLKLGTSEEVPQLRNQDYVVRKESDDSYTVVMRDDDYRDPPASGVMIIIQLDMPFTQPSGRSSMSAHVFRTRIDSATRQFRQLREQLDRTLYVGQAYPDYALRGPVFTAAEGETFIQTVNLQATTDGGETSVEGLAEGVTVSGIDPNDTLVVRRDTTSPTYIAYSVWGVPEISGPSTGSVWRFHVIYDEDTGDEEEFAAAGSPFDGFAAAAAAADAQFPNGIELTGHSSYTFYIQDTPMFDNEGGMSLDISTKPPAAAYVLGEFDPQFNIQEFLAPRDVLPTAFECWERGGVALADVSQSVDVQDWFFRCDSETGVVYVGVPDVIAEAEVHTIDPLPVQVTGSFDTTMRPVIAWKDVDGDAFIRYWSGASYTVLALPVNTTNVRLCLDDVRDVAFELGWTDTVLAYTRHNSLYVRLGDDDYADEILIQAGGFPTLAQIGASTELRFQFARYGEQLEAATPLMYLRPDNRATQLVGFDSVGGVTLTGVVTAGVQGAAGPNIHIDKLVTGSGQTFFLRDADGAWVNTSFQVTIDFYSESGDSLRTRRVLTFSIDATGNISRVTDSNTGEAALLIEEVGAGTRTYTATLSTREAKQGVTFNILTVSALPTFGTFLPNWNASKDFYGGQLVPTGRIAYADYGTYMTLAAADGSGYTARSSSTALRWGAGSLPDSLRPLTTRAVPCTVSNNGKTVAGVAEFYTDGSAQFWPLEIASTRLVKGSFAKSTNFVREKGLPVAWQLMLPTASLSGAVAPIPELTDIDPDTVDRFDTGVTMTITGDGFRPNSVAQIDGSNMPTVFNSATEVEATVADSFLELGTIYDITVATPTDGGGGGTSNALPLTVNNPVPVASTVDPDDIGEDSSDTAITVTGTEFVPESVVRVGGVAVATTYVDNTELTATILAASLANPGTLAIDVFNPAPAGGDSNNLTFTVNQAPDPHFASVGALLHFEGTDASTTFTDVKGKTWTAAGNAQIDTAQFKFGAASGLFDGTGDWVSTPNHADWNFGSGDFTVECFARFGSVSGSNKHILGHYNPSPGDRMWLMQYVVGTGLLFTVSFNGAATLSAATAGVLSTNTWYHLAATRSGATLRVFVNGVVGATTQNLGANSIHNASQPFVIGNSFTSGGGPFTGHIDEVRVTKGVARYTANFTPPSFSFPDA